MNTIQTIKKKVQLRLFQSFLNANDFPTGRNFDSIFLKIESKIYGDDTIDNSIFEDKLNEFLLKYLCFGRKIQYSFRYNREQINHFIELFHENDNYQDNLEDYAQLNHWSHEQLTQAPLNRPVFLTSFNFDNKLTCLIYSSKRKENKQHEISQDFLTGELLNYETIYGIKSIVYQAYDCVIVDHENLTIDFLIENSVKLSYKQHYNYFNDLRNIFRDQFGIDSSLFAYPMNFFGAINRYYESQEGVIRELGFKTSTGSVKVETMRDTLDDLRRESYHAAGTNAVARITPFSIDITFNNHDTNNQIRQIIPGNFRLLDVANPRTNSCEFIDILNENDYLFLKDKVINVISVAT